MMVHYLLKHVQATSGNILCCSYAKYMLLICYLYVAYILLICYLYVTCMLRICYLYATYMLLMCSLHVTMSYNSTMSCYYVMLLCYATMLCYCGSSFIKLCGKGMCSGQFPRTFLAQLTHCFAPRGRLPCSKPKISFGNIWDPGLTRQLTVAATANLSH